MLKSQLSEELKKLLRRKRSKKYYAERLEVAEDIIDELMQEIKNTTNDLTETSNYVADLEEHVRGNFDKGTFESTLEVDFKPKTEKELAQLHKVDTNKYKISSYWSKLKSNGKFTSSVFCTLKKAGDITPEDVLKVLENYKSTYQPHTKLNILINDVYAEPCSAFIDLTDFHLGKKELQGTTPEEKQQMFYTTIDRLLYKAYKSHKIEEIVFIVGSDFFHTDNNTMSPSGNTERGTMQETNMYWFEEYALGFDMNVNVINKLKQYCERLKVILVQGNHDRQKSFYLAHALSKYFSPDTSIEFDIAPEPRKAHIYGNTFIGLHHGDCKNLEKLPLVFAQQFSELWGPCKFKEIKVGDKHHYMEKEIEGVRIKQLPSLSGTDTYHNMNNYHLSIRAGIISIYHPTKGRVSEYEERI